MTIESKPDLREFRSAKRFFERHFAELRRQYRGEYIAILGGSVIHHDADLGSMASWVRRNVPGKPVFQPFVGNASSTTLHSPGGRLDADSHARSR